MPAVEQRARGRVAEAHHVVRRAGAEIDLLRDALREALDAVAELVAEQVGQLVGLRVFAAAAIALPVTAKASCIVA
jgi:hypothetical protein